MENVDYITEEQLRLLTELEAKFIFEQAEKQFNHVTDLFNAIHTKAISLLTIMVGLFVVLCGVMINKFDAIKFDSFYITSIIGCVYIFAILILLTSNLYPHKLTSKGTSPRSFFAHNKITESNSNERQKLFYISEIIALQKKIDINEAVLKRKILRYEKAINRMRYLPLILWLIYGTIFLIDRMYSLYHNSPTPKIQVEKPIK